MVGVQLVSMVIIGMLAGLIVWSCLQGRRISKKEHRHKWGQWQEGTDDEGGPAWWRQCFSPECHHQWEMSQTDPKKKEWEDRWEKLMSGDKIPKRKGRGPKVKS